MLQRSRSHSLHVLRAPLLAAAAVATVATAALVLAAPVHATVSTVFTCPTSGHDGSHDNVFNGMLILGLHTTNLNTVTLFYTTDTDGLYTLSLTARSGSFGGPLIGSTLTQMVNLSASEDTQVVWNFAGAAFPSGQTAAFTHVASGPGSVMFNLQNTTCAGDEETVGTSTTDNGPSVATTITENVTTGGSGCAANATTLCIDDVPGDKRFQITSSFATVQAGGESGNGHAVPLSSVGVTEGGLFWFFQATNPEMLVKVINGCALNSHFWVFYSAGTNVGFTVTVTDTKTTHSVKYQNTDLTAAPPEQDTGALPCP
jgi:hypothetical protein